MTRVPAGAADLVAAAEVLEHLRRSVRELGQTVVMVTHDRDAATYADDVVTMQDGRIA
jgi:putative ABC transport system ATP-binding protein